MSVRTPIDIFLKNTVQMDVYLQLGNNWKGATKSYSTYLPSSFISESGVNYNGGFVHSGDTSAELWTKNNLKYKLNDIVYDKRTNRRYSITGYTPYFHDQPPYYGKYWFTKVQLKFVGNIN